MTARSLLLALLLVAGCESPAVPSGGDLSASVSDGGVDLAPSGDGPTTCNPSDPMTDQQACASGCPGDTVAVNLAKGGCRCLYACQPLQPTTCPCDRFCATLTRGDAGIVGGGCLPGNGRGERCGADATGAPIGNGICAQGLVCAGATAASEYCLAICQAPGDCPRQTFCDTVTQSGATVAMACAYAPGPTALGAPCSAAAGCVAGTLCDGTCRTQCDGPGDLTTCTGGLHCTSLLDGPRILGYVCK